MNGSKHAGKTEVQCRLVAHQLLNGCTVKVVCLSEGLSNAVRQRVTELCGEQAACGLRATPGDKFPPDPVPPGWVEYDEAP